MILAPLIMHLHAHGCLICLDVAAADQLHPHGTGYRNQQPADRHHPTIHGRRLTWTPSSRSRTALCRYSGRWSQYFETMVSITTRSLTRPLSMIRAGAGAVTT